METIILTVVYVAVVLGLVAGILFEFGRDIERVSVTWMLYSFAIIIVTMVWVAGVLGKGLVTGILYGFDIYNGGICYRLQFYTLLKPIIVNAVWVAAVLRWD